MKQTTAGEATTIQTQFGRAAQAYVTSTPHSNPASLARVVELAQPQPTWRVLDIATGGGHTALALAPWVAQVVALDITLEMLQAARRHITHQGLTNVVFTSGDAQQLPLAAGRFDLVTCRIAPHHFTDIPAFLDETARVLQPAGRLVLVDNIVTPQAATYVNAFERLRDPSHVRCLTQEEWAQELFAAGLELVYWEPAVETLDFDEWTTRMQVPAIDRTRLRVMLKQAPAEAADFLTPQFQGDRISFRLMRGLFVAQRRA